MQSAGLDIITDLNLLMFNMNFILKRDVKLQLTNMNFISLGLEKATNSSCFGSCFVLCAPSLLTICNVIAIHCCCLMLCSADNLCISETPTISQTANSCSQHAVMPEDRYLQSNASNSTYTNSCCATSDVCTSNSSPCSCRHCTDWRPLLLVIPMRLGLSDVNPIYFDAVKVCMFLYY